VVLRKPPLCGIRLFAPPSETPSGGMLPPTLGADSGAFSRVFFFFRSWQAADFTVFSKTDLGKDGENDDFPLLAFVGRLFGCGTTPALTQNFSTHLCFVPLASFYVKPKPKGLPLRRPVFFSPWILNRF